LLVSGDLQRIAAKKVPSDNNRRGKEDDTRGETGNKKKSLLQTRDGKYFCTGCYTERRKKNH
jgi:hypothetical protein